MSESEDDERDEPDEAPPAKLAKLDESRDGSEDDGLNCPVCFEPWTSAGEHRLAALKCGHLFGHSCLVRWIRELRNKTCPTCKARALVRDARFVYAKAVRCVDSSELEALRLRVERAEAEKNRCELEMRRMACAERANLERIAELEDLLRPKQKKKSFDYAPRRDPTFERVRDIDMRACRVLAYCPSARSLAVSHGNPHPRYPCYSVRKFHCEREGREGRSISLHSKEIRAIAHSDESGLLVCASLDRSASVVDLHRETKALSVSTPLPLWSCCWDRDEPATRFYVGTVRGDVLHYDTRQTKVALATLRSEDDHSPAVALASLPGGVVACQLNTLKAYKRVDGAHRSEALQREGPYLHLDYCPKSDYLFASTRPNSTTPRCRHMLCRVDLAHGEDGVCDVVSEVRGSAVSTLMSKGCRVDLDGDLYSVYNENEKTVDVWDMFAKRKAHSLPSAEPVLDMCSWGEGDDTYLVTLSQNKIKIYKSDYRDA